MRLGNQGFLVIECRRYPKSRLPQKDAGELAFVIEDLGASGGILVSPLGFQKGAKKIAEAKKHRETIPLSQQYDRPVRHAFLK